MPVGNIVLCAAAPTSPRAVGSLFCEASGQHGVMPASGLLFLRSPVVVVVHPSETATLLVRFRIDVIFPWLIMYVCCFVLFCGGEKPRVLRGEGKPLDARRCS
jgi:hypothetical protein